MLRATRDQDRVLIEVHDEGRGIPPELHARIFERFFQVDEAITRSTGGLGVGLYLVRRLCELMGGEVSVSSDVGRGATFKVVLRGAVLP
jgi:signal transduction histidine kinase